MIRQFLLALMIVQSCMLLFFYLTEGAHEVLVVDCSLESRSGFSVAGMPSEKEYFVRVHASMEGYGLITIDRPPLSVNRPPNDWRCDRSKKTVVFSKFNPSGVRFIDDPRDLGMFGGLLMLVCVWMIAGGWRFFVRK